MISDLLATSAAFLLFVLVIFVPGYVFAWFADLFGFGRRSLLARFAISIPLSVGVCPILTYLLWHLSIVAVWSMYAGCLLGFLGLFVHERQIWFSKFAVSRRIAIVLAIIAGWVVLGLFCLVDLQIGHRLYYPTAAYDYTLRTTITSAITRTGIPPQNPYFFPGRHFLLRYHYFWFILCSLVDQLGGSLVSARQAMLAGTLWGGIGLMALVPLYLRFFQPKGSVNLDRRMLVGIALLGVTGLDILPVTIIAFTPQGMLPTIEWWNNQVSAWITAVLWVPHHVAALIACLTGFLVIRCAPLSTRRRGPMLSGVVAGLTFASSVGLSIYVTFVFAIFLAIWLAITILKKNSWDAFVICVAGVVSLAAATPYLVELLRAPSGGSGSFLQLTVRWFSIPEVLLVLLWPDSAGWPEHVANGLFLPLNYYLELGFFFKIGLMQWKRMRSGNDFFQQKELCGFVMAVTSVVICTFVRSGVITANDLGWRGFMVAQFILLIWAAEMWDDGLLANRAASQQAVTFGRDRRGLLIGLLVLGVAGSVYEVCMFRFFPLISDHLVLRKWNFLSPDLRLGDRTYALRQVYETLKKKLPDGAIVQHNPNAVPGDMFYGLYADRQAAAETSQCGVVFGGDPALCRGVVARLDDLFEKPGAVEPGRVDPICNELSIDALVVKDTDKVWTDKNSWVWKKQPVLANGYARAFLCGRQIAR